MRSGLTHSWDAVYFADFRTSQTTALLGAVGRSAGLIIPPELGGHADFNGNAINFFVQSDQNYKYADQVNRARALQDVFCYNVQPCACRVQVEIKLNYPTLPNDYKLPRYIPIGGHFRIVAPESTCGSTAAIDNRILATANVQDLLLQQKRALVALWRQAAVAKVNGRGVPGWTALSGLASEVLWLNPEPLLNNHVPYVTAAADPAGWSLAWFTNSGPALTEARVRQGMKNVGNQVWNPSTAVRQSIQVGSLAHGGVANQGAFTYTLDAVFERVVGVTGKAWATNVVSRTQFGGTTVCDAMYFADFRKDRIGAGGVGESAGHIIAPSIAGPPASGGTDADEIFNQHPVNFFPQSGPSNQGPYNHQEQGIQGFMTTVSGMGNTYIGCHPIVTISFTYGNQPTSNRYIPTGGTYSVSIPLNDCGGLHSLDDLILAIRAYNPLPNIANSLERKIVALQWLHPIRRDEANANVASLTAQRDSAQNAWNQLPPANQASNAFKNGAGKAAWNLLAVLKNQVTQATNAADPKGPIAIFDHEFGQEGIGIYSPGLLTRFRLDNNGRLVKSLDFTNP